MIELRKVFPTFLYTVLSAYMCTSGISGATRFSKQLTMVETGNKGVLR